MSKKFKQPKPKGTLKAIDKLITFYEKYSMFIRPPSYHHIEKGECPLCCIYIKGECQTSCNDCPWYTIEGIGCMDSGYVRHTTKERLLRLRRWKKKIQGGI